MQRKRISKRCSIKYIVLFFVVCSCCDENSKEIVPGIRVGKYFFGKTTSEQIFREPEDKDKLINEGLMFTFNTNNKLDTIAVSSKDYRTKENIGVGSTKEAIIDVFGPSYSTGTIQMGEEVFEIDGSLAYDNMIFYCDDKGIVTYILLRADVSR